MCDDTDDMNDTDSVDDADDAGNVGSVIHRFPYQKGQVGAKWLVSHQSTKTQMDMNDTNGHKTVAQSE